MNKRDFAWEIVGYISLALCIFGQIAVGYWYLLAQVAYLVANLACVVRCFALGQPSADKVKNIAFLAITAGLIFVRVVAS